MEQKRTLWIMAAVGVFLLVVLGAALILYSPTARSSQTIATVSPSNKQTSNGWVSLAPAENETTIPQTKMPATEVLSEQTNEVPQQNVINSEEKITRVAELTVYADKATIISNNPNEMNTQMTSYLTSEHNQNRCPIAEKLINQFSLFQVICKPNKDYAISNTNTSHCYK